MAYIYEQNAKLGGAQYHTGAQGLPNKVNKPAILSLFGPIDDSASYSSYYSQHPTHYSPPPQWTYSLAFLSILICQTTVCIFLSAMLLDI